MKSLWRIMRYMRPYRLVIVFGVITVILPVAMELLVPRLLQNVIDDGIRQMDMDAIVSGALAMVVAALVTAVSAIVQGICRATLSQGMAFDMRNDLFQHIQSLPFATLDRMQTGGLMTRISSDVDMIRMFSSNGLALILRAVLMISGSVVMILLTNAQLSVVMLICLAIAGVMIWQFLRIARPYFDLVQKKLSVLNTIVQENLAGTHLVKAFVRERYETDRFDERSLDYMRQNIRVGRILSLVMPVLTVVTNLGIVAVIWFGGYDVIGGRLSIGQLIAFNNYLMIGMTPLLLLGNMVTAASRAEVSAGRVLEVFEKVPMEDASESPYASEDMRGHIVFEDVSFHYNAPDAADELDAWAAQPVNGNGSNGSGGRGEVLDHLSFEALPGQRIALLGATGSGKSTLVSLITRYYDVTRGRVLVDGVDVRDWDREALRSQTGVVLQHTTLFSGTVRDNIAYGNPNASLEDVIAAAQAAQAHDFIMAMPEGYDSIVEARGANLSGGQKQRIAIARALLIKPRIIILDDSTSAVDLDTEIRIQDALEEQLSRTTSLIIAQRINSVLSADQIIVLEAGHVVATGNHEELLRGSPIYQDIYRSQFGAEALEAAI